MSIIMNGNIPYLPSLLRWEGSELFEEIKRMKVDPKNEESVQAFKREVSKLYFVLCVATPNHRGSAQHALEVHHLLHAWHRLPFPVPNQEAILPDCWALSLTEEQFKDRYPDAWEKVS